MTRFKDYYDKLKADPQKYAEYLARKRSQAAARTVARPGYRSEHGMEWRRKNPEKAKLFRRVQFAVYRAVASGKLARPKACSKCGAVGKIEAHHHRGYEKEFWLDVVWLCKTCHTDEHSGDEVQNIGV